MKDDDMSDGEKLAEEESEAIMWAELRTQNRAKKMSNKEKSTAILKEQGIKFIELSPWHYWIGDYDLWPTTGKYQNRITRKWGRGVFNLMRELK